jgi:hypothetical protein
MNLICFPHYTCGGLLCDIFNQTMSPVGKHGGINSIAHNIGKIGDSDKVFDNYDPLHLAREIQKLDKNIVGWVGTHCWPGTVDISMFDKVLLITTTTFRSKLYRWTRAYHHYYANSLPWLAETGQARIDKERETAKNYLLPFLPINSNNVTNVEFSEVVESTVEFQKIIEPYQSSAHIDRWKLINKFLYDSDIWHSLPFKRLHEAEVEINLKKFYVYE